MLVSIIICSHNSAAILDGALYSALSQEFPTEEYEVLLVDDGSTDQTVELAASYERRHGNFRYVRLPLSKGKSAAGEQGLQTARGKYFTSLEPDDALHPRMLMECVAPLEQGLADLSYCDYHEVSLSEGSHRHVRLSRFDPVGMIGRAAMLRVDDFLALAGPLVEGGNGQDVYQRYVQASGMLPHRVPRPLYYRCLQSPEAAHTGDEANPGRSLVDISSDGAVVHPEQGRERILHGNGR